MRRACDDCNLVAQPTCHRTIFPQRCAVVNSYVDDSLAASVRSFHDHHGSHVETVERTLTEYLLGMRYEDIPQDVLDATKLYTLECIGHMVSCNTGLPGGAVFGDMALSKVTWKSVEELYAKWEGDLSPIARARYASTLSKAFDHAKRTGWIRTNPAREARTPRVPTHKPQVPSSVEFAKPCVLLASASS
jgi:hypothetical protein